MGSDEEEQTNDAKKTYTELDKVFENEDIDENKDLNKQNEDLNQKTEDKSESETEEETSEKKDEIEPDEEVMETNENTNQDTNQNIPSKGDNNLYTWCPQCQKHIFIQYKKEHIENAKSYPVYIVWVHGKPFHGLLVRIDKNLDSRGERIVQLEFDAQLSDLYKE